MSVLYSAVVGLIVLVVLFCPCVVSWRLFRRSHVYVKQPIRNINPVQATSETPVPTNAIDNSPASLRNKAMELLDCLTSTRNEDDPEYNFEKDMRRNDLLLANDYMDLKLELRRKGLKASGDKLEMITRLLLHHIDPSIKYDELTGAETKLSYIDDSDLKDDKVRIRTTEERSADSMYNLNPDADDMGVLKGRSFSDHRANMRQVMDGLIRKEVSFSPVRLRRTEEQARRDDYSSQPGTISKIQRQNAAYLVMGKNVLQNWQYSAPAVVLLPSRSENWCSKSVRVIADEIAFSTQSVVIVPDIYRNLTYSSSMSNSLSVDTDWLDCESEEFERRCLDDVVAAMKFLRDERRVRVLSLSGVGDGAGRALEIACDLHDLGRAAQCERVEELFHKYSREVANATTLFKDVELPNRDKYAVINDILDSKDQSALNILKQASKEFESIFLSPATELVHDELILDKDEEDTTGTEEKEREDIKNAIERLLSGGETEGNIQDSSSAISEMSPAEKEYSSPILSTGGHEKVLADQLYTEWKRILIAARRARARKMLAPYASFELHELRNFIPRSVVAWKPQRFNVRRVGEELSCPAFVATSGDDPSSVGHQLSNIFSGRKHEIVDYCIREYKNISSSFTVIPMASTAHEHEEYDKRIKQTCGDSKYYELQCAQEAVDIGALWIEAFSGVVEEGMIQGAGYAKFAESAFVRVTKNDMKRIVRPSVVADYLHDDPNLFIT